MNELSQYSNIVCIINNNINNNLNDNINLDNNKISNIIFNSNTLGQKIKLLNFTSDWKKNLFFDSYNNSNIYIKSGLINSNIVQEYIFWFIDINNIFHENDCCFNAIIRIMWKSIQQQLNMMNFGIDIGQFNKSNMSVIFNKYIDMIMNYHNDLKINKKILYKSHYRHHLQNVFDYYFNKKKIFNKNNTNIYDNNTRSIKNNSDTKVINLDKNHLADLHNIKSNDSNTYQYINTDQNYGQNQERKYPHSQKNISNFNNFNNNMNINKQIDKNNDNINNSINNLNDNNNNLKSKLSILCIAWNAGVIPREIK
jgi:hypothetical protein